MDPRRFQRLKMVVERDLTVEQYLDSEAHLREVVDGLASKATLFERTRDVTRAGHGPRCGHHGVIRHGLDSAERQRFCCWRSAETGCGGTFNALTGTALAWKRMLERWQELAEPMRFFRSVYEGVSSDLGACRLKGLLWRHRLIKARADAQAAQFGSVVEADETFFRTPYKGHCGWLRGTTPENRPRVTEAGQRLAPVFPASKCL